MRAVSIPEAAELTGCEAGAEPSSTLRPQPDQRALARQRPPTSRSTRASSMPAQSLAAAASRMEVRLLAQPSPRRRARLRVLPACTFATPQRSMSLPCFRSRQSSVSTATHGGSSEAAQIGSMLSVKGPAPLHQLRESGVYEHARP